MMMEISKQALDPENKTRVLLVQPNFNPFQEFIPFLATLEPIALEILATSIEDLAEVEIFDRRLESEQALRRRLQVFKPDIVGTTTHSAGETNTSRKILRLAKQFNKETTTIIGGVHPTLRCSDYMDDDIDLVAIGYGEETMREVVLAGLGRRELDTIEGLAINGRLLGKPGRQIETPRRAINSRLMKMPSPNRSLVKKYRRHYWQGIVLSSRGCPYRCSFCALWKAAEGQYLLRPPEDVVEEIAAVPQKYVLLADDNTFGDIQRAKKLFQLIKASGIQKRYTCYARTDTIVRHPDLFRDWKSIGLDGLVIGFESFDDGTLKNLNKANSVQNNEKAVQILQELGITNLAHFIIPPEFKEEDFENLWSFIRKNGITSPYFPLLTPIPGTGLYDEAQQEGRIENHNFEYYNFEYMVMKTTLPKAEFYEHALRLMQRTVSPLHFLRLGKRRDMSLGLCFIRWFIMSRSIRRLRKHYRRQIKEEQEGDRAISKNKTSSALEYA